jgi:hypothetical protein
VKPLLVGDMPMRASDRYFALPLSGVPARTLCRVAGISGPSSRNDLAGWTQLLYEHFECMHAIKRHSKWDHEEATRRMGHFIVSRHEVVVLFGRKVQKAYCDMTSPATTAIENASFYENTDILSATGRRQVLVLPAVRVIRGMAPAHLRRVGRLLNEAMDKAREMEETRL